MKKYAHRKEYFGYLMINSEGRIDLYDKSVKKYLDCGNFERIETCKLATFDYDPDLFHLKSPVLIFIELTRKCNLRCSHCYIEGGQPRTDELSTREIITLLEELRELEVFGIIFTGGEPLLHTNIIEILRAADQMGFDFAVFTNGTMISPKLLEQIPKRTVFNVSLDGIKTNPVLRDGVSFRFMQGKLKILQKWRFTFACMITITRINLNELKDLIIWCADNNILFGTNDCMPIGRAAENAELLPTLADVQSAADLFLFEESKRKTFKAFSPQKPDEFGMNSLFDILYRLEYSTEMCKGARGLAYVTSDGLVYPCSNCASLNLFCGGNIKKDTFSNIWRQSFQKIRSTQWKDFRVCNDCELTTGGYYCKFRCPALSMKLHGELTNCGATPFLKESMKARTDLYQAGLM